MIIAINTRFMLSDNMEGYGNFIYETFSRMAKQHPEHAFIYIFDQPFDERFITSHNITGVVAGPSAGYPMIWKYWYDIKIPSVLKKIKADIFISCDGFCSLKTTIPQCLIMHDLAFLQQPLFIKKSHAVYIKKYTPKFLSKAKVIVTVSEFLKKELIDRYQVDKTKIEVAHYGVREIFQSLDTAEKFAVKELYTDGKEYFIYTGAIHLGKNLLSLLKAFSIFKKRQKTNMKLVLAGNIDPKYDSFQKDLQTYKFRSDVILTDSLFAPVLEKLTGAAYGFITASPLEEFPVAAIEAMQSDVPVVAVETNTMKEIVNDAAIYADETSHSAIADKMMLLYKDERLRNDLIIKGRKVVAAYSWDKTVDTIWQQIAKLNN